MSFIHKFIEDKETPEPIQWLFRRFVSEFDKQDSTAWNKQVKQTTDEFHRKTLLKQGRCDFDKPQLNLTSEELIVLYNYYYFPMHFQSSYEIYNKLFEEHEEFENKTFFFHDYGCGTLSSSMAFGASFQKHNLSEVENQNEFKYNHIDVLSHLHFYVAESAYGDVTSGELGIIRNAANIQYFNLPNLINGYSLNDISTTITKFLERFLAESFYTEPYQYYFFNTASCTDSHFYFGNVSDKFYLGNFGYDPIQPFKSFCNSQLKSTNEIVVILNFSYVLASESIEIESINSIINEYTKTGCRLIIVNQNPDLESLNTKWEQLKDKIKFVKSVNGVQPIKHFGSKSKARFEVVFPTTNEILFEQFVALIKESKYYELEKQLNDYFKSNLFHPELFSVEVDMLNKRNYFDLCNYITDFAFSHNYLGIQKYYHQKAHLYRDINSINIAKSYYEKDIIERNGHRCICYKVFINKYFPEIKPFIIKDDDDDLPF